MVLKLISHHLCPYVQRSVIVLLEKNVDFERKYIDLSDKPDWFLDISPLGRVPLLLVDDRLLFESAVICEFVDEITPGSLHPDDPYEKARHRSWIEFGSATLDVIGGFYNAKDPEALEAKRVQLIDRLRWLEAELGEGRFFDGDEFHMVDAVYATVFRYFDVIERVGDFNLFQATAKICAWRDRLAARDTVRQGAVEDYGDRLMAFFLKRDSELGRMAQAVMAA